MSSEAKQQQHSSSTVLYKQGPLKKQGGSMGGWKTWKLRWFVFHEGGLSYYESDKDYINCGKELGYLQFDTNFSFTDYTDSNNKAEDADCYFKINSTGRSMLVKSKTNSEKRDWLTIVNRIRNEDLNN